MSDQEFPLARYFKLKNGDDVVTEVVEVSEDDTFFYTFISPLKVVYMPSTAGMLSIGFMPWVYPRIVDMQEFNVHADEVVTSADVSESMNEFYWKHRDSYLVKQSDNEIEEALSEEEEIDADTLQEILDSIRDSGKTFH